MTLLDFARGPALEWAAVIFVVGLFWRIGGLIFLTRARPLSRNRRDDLWRGGWRMVWSRFIPNRVFRDRISLQFLAGWVWHVGFFVVLLMFEVHILFFEGLFGLSWPALPNTVILVAAAVTAGLLVMLLIRRATQPVLRAISGFDDYASVVVVLLPLLTGLASYAHLGLAYETMLALHLLSVALLLVWLPFSKLVHVITMLPSRYVMGVKFWRRGVEV